MDPDKVEEISKKAISYFRKRKYIVGDTYLNRDTQVSKSDRELLDAVDSGASSLNLINSLSSVAYELSQAEQQFTLLKTWICESLNERPQTDLSPMLMPVLCHLYLDSLRLHPKQDCINFFMMFSLRLINEEWYPCVEQLLNAPTSFDLAAYPLVKAFRESKFRLKLTHDSLVLLRKFLSVKELNIIIAVLQTWFEFAEDEDEEEQSEDENLETNRFDGAASSEDESPVRTYKGPHSKKMEELMKEIKLKRLQPTPPPPLLLYTVYRSEGIVCGRISEQHYLAATGDKRSEVRIWGLGENRILPKLHESYFQSVPLGEVDSDTDSECAEPYEITSEDITDFEPQPSTSSQMAPTTSRIHQDSNVKVEKHVGEEISNDDSENESSESEAENELHHTTFGRPSKKSPTHNKPKIPDHHPTMSPGGISNDQDSMLNMDNSDTLSASPSQQMWPLRGHSDAVYDVAFLPNCPYLVSVSFDTTMRLWNLSDFSCPVVYRGHSSPVWSVAVSTIANYVATASSDKTAKLWCLDRTFPVRVMAGHLQAVTCVAFHPNGSYLATGSPDRTVRLWSITDGAMVRVMGGVPGMGSVETLAFSPNGQYVASAGEDKCVWLWDLASANYILKLTGHTCRIVSVDWSIDSSTVSAASLNGTILLWPIDNKEPCGGNIVPKKYETNCAYLLSMEYSRNNSLLALGLKERHS